MGPRSKQKYDTARIGFAEDQNKKFRRTMEDGHYMNSKYSEKDQWELYSIFDGHGGREAVDIVQREFPEIFFRALKEHPENTPVDAMRSAFRDTDSKVLKKDVLYSGTTAVCCYIQRAWPPPEEPNYPPDTDPQILKETFYDNDPVPQDEYCGTLFTGNLGDARAVLSRGGHAIRLSRDHKPADKAELERIRLLGGFVLGGRVNGILGVSRALGDHCLKDFVTSNAFVSRHNLRKEDEFLIIACDGLWDVLTDDVAVTEARSKKTAQDMADHLLEQSLERGSVDNISILVVKL